MRVAGWLRQQIKAARKRGSPWVRLLDFGRSMMTAAGRSRLWTQFVHGKTVHQTTPFTAEERYPTLFDTVARLAPEAGRILSFGCSTGEELLAIRRRFPAAHIVGAEINPRSRRIALKRTASDANMVVVSPNDISGAFDAIFALAVFQREPHKVEEMGLHNLTPFYPFERFNGGVSALVERLRPGGLLCVINSQYRVEDSTAARLLKPVLSSPEAKGPFFNRDGQREDNAVSRTVFERLADEQ